MALTKQKLVKWLLKNDFQQLPSKQTSHRRYRHKPTGVVITIPMHGRPELSKKHLGMLLRQLEEAGFNKEQTRVELS